MIELLLGVILAAAGFLIFLGWPSPAGDFVRAAGTALAAAATVAATVVALFSARAAQKAAASSRDGVNAQAMLGVVGFLQSSEMRLHRRTLLSSTSDWPWPDDVIHAGEEVAAAFHTAGFLAATRLVDERLIIENWGAQVVQCWNKTLPLVNARIQREKNEHLWEWYYWLAARSCAAGKFAVASSEDFVRTGET